MFNFSGVWSSCSVKHFPIFLLDVPLPTSLPPTPTTTWLDFHAHPFHLLHVSVSCLLSFVLPSNLCQWRRLKGSVHVWTNPCVSDGFQPCSLFAQPHGEHISHPFFYSGKLRTCMLMCVITCRCLWWLFAESKLLHRCIHFLSVTLFASSGHLCLPFTLFYHRHGLYGRTPLACQKLIQTWFRRIHRLLRLHS